MGWSRTLIRGTTQQFPGGRNSKKARRPINKDLTLFFFGPLL